MCSMENVYVTSSKTDSSACEEYLKWYFDGDIWRETTFLGINAAKSVSDMWNYQEILHQLKPTLVVEFGTHMGGSALYFSTVMQTIGHDYKILSVDIDHSRVDARVKDHDKIELMTSSSIKPEVATRIKQLRAEYPGRCFFILDSDHSKKHVLAEMELIRPLIQEEDYLIVEDGCVNGHPVLPNWGEGPLEAIREYRSKYPNDFTHDIARENKFGFTFAPGGFLVPNHNLGS